MVSLPWLLFNFRVGTITALFMFFSSTAVPMAVPPLSSAEAGKPAYPFVLRRAFMVHHNRPFPLRALFWQFRDIGAPAWKACMVQGTKTIYPAIA